MSSTNNNQFQRDSSNSGTQAPFNMEFPRKELAEDGPELRSVAISSIGPKTLGADVPSFAKPLPGMGGAAFVMRRPEKAQRSRSFVAQQEWTARWEVCNLGQVPIDFPLERTHREIFGADASEVAARISDALRLLSIEAEYDGKHGKAKCTSTDMVNFRIRLFAGGENGLPVVVEVQRRSGSASSFMRTCRAILDAAEGKKVDGESAKGNGLSCMSRPVANMKCLQSVTLASTPSGDMESGLDKCLELLRSNKKDLNLLGLENLSHLTDALKTRPDIAVMVSKVVVLGDEKYDLREDVASVLQRDVFIPDDEHTVVSILEKSRHTALLAFSNALSLTSKDGCLAEAVRSQPWFANFLIPTLVDELKLFPSSANNAYEAACGLTALATCSDVARKTMKDNGAVDEIQAAYKYGLENHELLANETKRCMKALG